LGVIHILLQIAFTNPRGNAETPKADLLEVEPGPVRPAALRDN
jgi:hypothetical protein